jgi:hypothetical protein
MKFDVQATNEGIQTEARYPRLDTPYCGPLFLESVQRDILGNGYLVLQFNWRLTDDSQWEEDVPQKVYSKTEWEPREEDFIPSDPTKSSKAQNLMNRIAYMLSYYVGEEDALELCQMQGSTISEAWENLVDRVVSHMQTVDHSRTIKGKILGSVYKGKERLDMPNYIGFLSDENSEVPVTFSRRDKKQNAEYLTSLQDTPADNDTMDDESDLDDLDF